MSISDFEKNSFRDWSLDKLIELRNRHLKDIKEAELTIKVNRQEVELIDYEINLRS